MRAFIAAVLLVACSSEPGPTYSKMHVVLESGQVLSLDIRQFCGKHGDFLGKEKAVQYGPVKVYCFPVPD